MAILGWGLNLGLCVPHKHLAQMSYSLSLSGSGFCCFSCYCWRQGLTLQAKRTRTHYVARIGHEFEAILLTQPPFGARIYRHETPHLLHNIINQISFSDQSGVSIWLCSSSNLSLCQTESQCSNSASSRDIYSRLETRGTEMNRFGEPRGLLKSHSSQVR